MVQDFFNVSIGYKIGGCTGNLLIQKGRLR